MSYYPSYATLKCFEIAARHLSFTHAARELCLTQGAVSHHIQKLEKQLCVQLFDRQPGKLVLTEVGARYLYEILPALDCVKRATDNVRNASCADAMLRLAVPPTFAEYWLMPRLNKFTLSHPSSRLQITVCSGGMIDKSAADVAFALGLGEYDGCESIKVLALVYRPYLRADLPGVRDLAANAVLSKAQWAELLKQYRPLLSSKLENWQGWLQKRDLLNEVDMEYVRSGPRYATASLALQAALDGVGVALLPDYVVARMPESAQLRCLDAEGWLSNIGYHMFWDKSKASSGATRDFIEWAQREFA